MVHLDKRDYILISLIFTEHSGPVFGNSSESYKLTVIFMGWDRGSGHPEDLLQSEAVRNGKLGSFVGKGF